MQNDDREKNVRNLPAPPDGEGRVETGAVQFGDDWPGLFVRGDDCGALFVAWQSVEAQLPDLPRPVEAVITRIMEIIRDDIDCGDALKRFEAGEKHVEGGCS